MELKLSPKDRRSLEAVVAAPVDAKQLKRAQGLLAVADGESPTVIARRLQVTAGSKNHDQDRIGESRTK